MAIKKKYGLRLPDSKETRRILSSVANMAEHLDSLARQPQGMTRPVYIAGSGLLCARGDAPAPSAEALWAGEYQAANAGWASGNSPISACR
jgi:hypothetical protein